MKIRWRDGLFHQATNGLGVWPHFGIPDRVVQGALNGFKAWMWYAVVEYVFNTALPVLAQKYRVVMMAQSRAAAGLFLGYAIIGIGVGLASAFLIDRHGGLTESEFRRRSQMFAILATIVAFGINLIVEASGPSLLSILTTLLIAGAAVWDGYRPHGGELIRHPEVVSATLLASTKLSWGGSLVGLPVYLVDFPLYLSIPIILLVTLAMVGLAMLAIRVASRLESRRFWSPAARTSSVVAVTALVLFLPGILSSLHVEAESESPPKPSGVARPNIILITLDTVRADHMGIYGYTRQNTPNLSALSKECSLYTDFSATSTLTLTSHASIFTGLYPHSHGAFEDGPDFPAGRPLSAGIPTVASIMGAAGYRTGVIAANRYYLRPEFGLTRDFQYSWLPRPEAVISQPRKYLMRTLLRQLLTVDGFVQDLDSMTVSGEDLNRQAFTILDKYHGQDSPFFLFLNYMDAHNPYVPPAPFSSLYPGRDLHFPSWNYEAFKDGVNAGKYPLRAVERDHLISQYDGAIAYLDYNLGELIRHLKKSGQYNQTMIVITSDHGEALGERGILGHNHSLYQDQIRIPLLIKFPHREQAETVRVPASHIDLLPTMLDVAGLPAPPGLPGTSLRRTGLDPARVIISERHEGFQPTDKGLIPSRIQYTVLSGSLKFIRSEAGAAEVYDLSSDPDERNNLYRPEGTAYPALNNQLQQWMRDTKRHYSTQPLADRKEMNHLRSLGYLQ